MPLLNLNQYILHLADEFARNFAGKILAEHRWSLEKAVEMLKQALVEDDTALIKQRVEVLRLLVKSMQADSPPSSQSSHRFDPSKTKILD